MNVLITGGAGFIGTHLARKLSSSGHEITLLDNFSPQVHGADDELPHDLKGAVRLVRGDVRDEAVWASVLPGHQAVVNLAAETGTGQSMYRISQYEQVNIAGTANLYEQLARNKAHKVERIVVASSRAVYGEGAYRCAEDGLVYPQSRSSSDKLKKLFDPVCPLCGNECISVPTPENAPLQPSSFYGLTKQMQEQMTMMFGQVFGIPSFALRYQNVYGPGQSLQNPYTGILAIFSNLARTGSDISVFEDGVESRDFVYIDDVVSATAKCVESAAPGQHVLNIGSGESTSVLNVARAINSYFGDLSKITVSGAFRQGDVRHGLADIREATKEIGYIPQWKFEEGLRSFLSWAGESDPTTSTYKHSLSEMKERGLLHDGV